MELGNLSFLQNIIEKEGDKSLQSLSTEFGREGSREDRAYAVEEQNVLSLFKNITSMMLTQKSNNEPFQPLMQMADGRRSALPEDLSHNELTILASLVERINHVALKARVYDLLWICCKPKKPSHAKYAIDFYIKDGIKVDTWRHTGKKEIERAYRLARQLNDRERVTKIEKIMISSFNNDAEGFVDIAYSIAELVENLNALKEHNFNIAERLESLGSSLKSKGHVKDAIRYFELSSRKYKKCLNEGKHVVTLVQAAESYALDAENHFNLGAGSKLIANSLFENAIHAYRKVPVKYRDEYSIDERISKLRHGLNESGKHTLIEMGLFQTPIEGADEVAQLSKSHVAGKGSEYEALVYFSGICNVDKYDSLMEREKKSMSSNFLSSFFGSTQYAIDGRVIAKTPSVGLGDDQESVNVTLCDNMVRTFSRNIKLNVKLAIVPALHQILSEHSFSKNFIFEICDYSPLIPKSSVHLISHALWLGLEFEFSTAIHIIAPQLEKIVREQLKKAGAHTTHLDKTGIEHEKGLSTLLDMHESFEVFGQDHLFELTALFTNSIGPNLRNEVAHGLLTDNAAYSEAPIYAWWVLMRMTIHSIITSSEEKDNAE
jgi:tetratricopeptide (TPR) repeat protein